MQDNLATAPTNELMDRLSDLCRLDQEAVGAYDNIMAAVGDDNWNLTKILREIRDEHAEHVISVSSMMAKLGMEPPARTPHPDGFLIGGMFSLREATGRAAALGAIRTNKMLTAAHYEAALYWEVPDALRALLERFAENERRQRDYLSTNMDLLV